MSTNLENKEVGKTILNRRTFLGREYNSLRQIKVKTACPCSLVLSLPSCSAKMFSLRDSNSSHKHKKASVECVAAQEMSSNNTTNSARSTCRSWKEEFLAHEYVYSTLASVSFVNLLGKAASLNIPCLTPFRK